MDPQTVTKINNMTFSELKNELYKCHNNPIKERIIRELMVIKYQQHINLQKNKQNKKPKTVPSQKPKMIEPIEVFSFDDFSLDDFNDDKKDFDAFDRNHIIEYKKDVTNNNLMDRLNNDMEIKKMKKSKNVKEIIKPFANTSCDAYATFKNEPGTHLKSFKNR
jgi:hypothetical protein